MDQQRHGPWDADRLQSLLLEKATLADFLTELAHGFAAVTDRRCGITTRGEQGPFTVASTDATVERLDEMQYANGHGPCLQAMRTGKTVIVSDLSTETRWTPYPSRAAQLGVTSILSQPLPGRQRTLGVLNLYRFGTDGADTDVTDAATRFAHRTAGALELALRGSEQSDKVANLQIALTTRSTIDQAIGILMAEQRCDAKTAFERLRATSQGRNQKLRDIAAQIVASCTHAAPARMSPHEA